MKTEYYVYLHYKTGEDKPFYVGKGKGERAYSTHNRSKYWHNVATGGYKVEYEFEQLDETTALQMEADLIQMWGRRNLNTGCLVNLTDGGDTNNNRVVTIDTRRRMRDAQLGKKRATSAVEKARQKLAGHPVSDETREKISRAQIGKVVSNETRDRLRQSHCKFLYTLTDPDGTTHRTTNLNQFCKEHRLTLPLLARVVRGIGNTHHKGWCGTRESRSDMERSA